MDDLYAALAMVALASFGLFCLSLWLSQHLHRWGIDLLSLLTIGGIAYYIVKVWDQPILAELLPYSSLIVLGNWFPLFCGFLSGLVWSRVPGSIMRKGLFVVGLGLASFYSAVHPLQGLPPICEDVWNENVCLQSSPATCSAACGATLLRFYDIATSESEMAELCLTRQGTHWQGLYRGLKLKTAERGMKVKFFRCTLEELFAMPAGPKILTVELKTGTKVELSEVARRGWIEGVSHSIVLMGRADDGRVLIGDPSIGPEIWTFKDFQTLWQGEGMRLIEPSAKLERDLVILD